MAHILLAEDNTVLAKVLGLKLEAEGFSVEVVHDGCAAWEYAKYVSFDLIITDYDMPKMKGGELCRHIRSDSRYDQTPIIMITSFDEDLDMDKLTEELGLSALVPKPFVIANLIKRVKKILTECHS